ncbi:MAG: DNA/RNA non-specific endonuclease [Bacteroides sp.]|nr:DNA/RNA non-specific endonuclease [Bacteroides sp.]
MSPSKRNRQNLSPRVFFIIFAVLIIIGLLIWWSADRDSSNPDHTVTTASAATHDGSGNSGETAHSSSSQNGITLEVTLPDGLPSQIMDYTGFSVSFNRDNHTPNYSSWELTGNETDGASTRTNKFLKDDRVAGCPTTRDYSNSGYDRGHMAPANDMKWSEKAMADCFYLTNICPQIHELNNGAWKTLEQKCQIWAKRDNSLYIIAGPIYTDNDTKRVGDIGVRVPSSFFKVIVAPEVDSPRGIAFVYPNMKSPGNMKDYSCTIDKVEEITGYDFFPTLSPELERQIESVADFKEWNKKQ